MQRSRILPLLIAAGFTLGSYFPASGKPIASDDPYSTLIPASGCSIAQAFPSPTPAGEESPAPSEPASPTPIPTPTATPSPVTTPLPFTRPGTGLPILVPQRPTPTPPTVTPPPPPTPTPLPTGSPGPVYIIHPSPLPSGATPTPVPTIPPAGASPLPSAPPPAAAGPTPVPTLGPDQVAVVADHVSGENTQRGPMEADGNVRVYYRDIILSGEHASFDGDHTMTISGHPSLRNQRGDAILNAQLITFDTNKGLATLTGGSGATTEGVERGRLYYTGRDIKTLRSGVTHIDRSSFTTCDDPKAGYHFESRSVDIYPGDKLVARKAVLFLGVIPVAYIPVLVIGLGRRAIRNLNSSAPELGYTQTTGFFAKERLGFYRSDDWYGYYVVNYFQKLGFELGFVAFYRRADDKRSGSINFDDFNYNRLQGGQKRYNLSLTDNENFSRRLRGNFAFQYNGNYGPFVYLPPAYSLNSSVSHAGTRSQENYTFSRYQSGGQQASTTYGFTETRQITDRVSEQINIGENQNRNTLFSTSNTDTLHFNSLTHITGKRFDTDITVDKTDATTLSGIDRLPEIAIRPRLRSLAFLPYSVNFVMGRYHEFPSNVETSKEEANLNLGPVYYRVFKNTDFNAGVNVRQEIYGTGDEKAQITQNMSLSSTLGNHVTNSLSYNEINTNGNRFGPFRTLDVLGGNSSGAQDVLRIFNQSYYNLTLSSGTSFNHVAQPISYQLTLRPFKVAYVQLGGAYDPSFTKFGPTNVQIATPFGHDSEIQFSANIFYGGFFGQRGIFNKAIYYRHIVGNCYEVQVAYREDLHEIDATINLLAFPSRTANFGINQNGPIIPQSFTFGG
ncbi:MAG: hypothetical protein KGM44_09525 [bacterium]|nr:hypothetical protein [bacterium]